MHLATKASDPYVQENRWIATLSDGRTIFQDVIPNEISAWRRLQASLATSDLKITGLRLQAFGQMITMPPPEEVSGYWQVSRISKSISSAGVSEKISRGIGYIKDGVTNISWVNEDGVVTKETRTYSPKNDLAGILHG